MFIFWTILKGHSTEYFYQFNCGDTEEKVNILIFLFPVSEPYIKTKS